MMHWARAGRVSRIPLRARFRGASTGRRSGADTLGVVALASATVDLIMSRFLAVMADGIPGGRRAISKAGRSIIIVGRAVAGGRGMLVSTLLKLAALGIEGVNLSIQGINSVSRISGGRDRRVRCWCSVNRHGR